MKTKMSKTTSDAKIIVKRIRFNSENGQGQIMEQKPGALQESDKTSP